MKGLVNKNSVASKERSSNFELMRLFLILFVIILHFNDTSRQGALTFVSIAPLSNMCFLFMMESLTICAVDAFVLLSGYFMTRKTCSNIRKVVNLFLTLVLYSFFLQLSSGIYNHDYSAQRMLTSLNPSNYYAWLYSTVFLLAPFLNIIMEKLDKKLDLFIVVILIFFSVIPTIIDYMGVVLNIEVGGMSTISNNGNGRGFTLVNFVLCYYVGGYLARKDVTGNGNAFLIYIVSSLLIFFGMFFNRSHALDYCNIFVIIQAAAFLLMFRNLNIKKHELINVLAKSVWGVFILHGCLMSVYSKHVNFENLVTGDLLPLILHFLVCIIAILVFSLFLDKVFSFALKPIHYIMDKIGFINKTISIE